MHATTVAIIGGGISGLACARALTEAGVAVRVFDKGRKAGGRLSTRRLEGLAFDHGAQYFTVRDPDFAATIAGLEQAGAVRRWTAAVTVLGEGALTAGAVDDRVRYVACPGMSGLARALSAGLDVVCGARMEAIDPAAAGAGWMLRDAAGERHGPFTQVVVAVPSGQAAPLLAPAPALARIAADTTMTPCLAAMVGVVRPLPLPWDGAFVQGGPVSWIARNSSKPGRPGPPGPECWVVHGAPAWSAANFERDPEDFAEALKDTFLELSGLETLGVTHLVGHRWRYAEVPAPRPERFLHDAALGLAACGDWCGGPRVEGAWCSGHALGRHLAAELAPRAPPR